MFPFALGSAPTLLSTFTNGTPSVGNTLSVPTGAKYGYVEMWGAGGGGAYITSANGGGKGGYQKFLFAVIAGKTYTYDIGQGGTKGNSGSAQNAGGSRRGGDGWGAYAAGGGATMLWQDGFPTNSTDMNNNVLGIAAGGGGAENGYKGGDGGDGTGETGGGSSPGTGGDQSNGGTIGGTFLDGGAGFSSSVAGGGAGKYGGGRGGAGGTGGAGGGSNFANSNLVTNASGTRGNNTGTPNYPGSGVGNGGTSSTSPTDGGHGYLRVEWWTKNPILAGLRT